MGGGGSESRRRYSSSFGHRYKDSLGGASEISAGSGERKERESDKGGVSVLTFPFHLLVILSLTTTYIRAHSLRMQTKRTCLHLLVMQVSQSH
jgi:hypothetical protein